MKKDENYLKKIFEILIKSGKDISKLEKKIITDKEGHQRTVYVKRDNVLEAKKREIREHKKKRLKGILSRLLDILESQYQGRGSEYDVSSGLREYGKEQSEIAKKKQELKNIKKRMQNERTI